MEKIIVKRIRQLVREVALAESMSADESKLKKTVVDALVSLYFRHEFVPADVVAELAASAQEQIDGINAQAKR